MKPLEIKGARTRLGYTQQFVADQLGMKYETYRKKESGEVRFTLIEAAKLAAILELNIEQLNDWLFDGMLPESCLQTV